MKRMKRIVSASCLILLLVVVGAAFLFLQLPPSGWADVTVGMAQTKVETLLGKPEYTFPSRDRLTPELLASLPVVDEHTPTRLIMLGGAVIDKLYRGPDNYSEGWKYPSRSIYGTPVYYYIFFDEAGHVVRTETPSDRKIQDG